MIPRRLTRLCIFCGSSSGNQPVYADAARRLGEWMASQSVALVYGGGSLGLMGVIADALLAGGGQVIGVIPHSLDTLEAGHRGISERHVVDTMHERKALMVEMSDGFITLPGGFGTLDEFFESLCWAQLGIHSKPCGLLNVGGYYDPLITFLDSQVRHGFVRPEVRDLLLIDDEPERLIERMKRFQPTVRMTWLAKPD